MRQPSTHTPRRPHLITLPIWQTAIFAYQTLLRFYPLAAFLPSLDRLLLFG